MPIAVLPAACGSFSPCLYRFHQGETSRRSMSDAVCGSLDVVQAQAIAAGSHDDVV